MTKDLILVVEDDDNIRQLYADALTGAGLSVITAKDGSEGVSLATQEHPLVILMDILMPGMSGQEAVEKIRLDDWGRHARVIYLTNLSDPENVFTAIQSNPEDYIIKANTDVKEVVNRVRLAMHRA